MAESAQPQVSFGVTTGEASASSWQMPGLMDTLGDKFANTNANTGGEDGKDAMYQLEILKAKQMARGGYFGGALPQLPEGYGSGYQLGNLNRNFSPADQRELPEQAPPERHVNNPNTTGTFWPPEDDARRPITMSDLQKELQRAKEFQKEMSEKLKAFKSDLALRYTNSDENKVLKQATVNADIKRQSPTVTLKKPPHLKLIGDFCADACCVNPNAPIWPKRDRKSDKEALHRAAKMNAKDICVMLLEARAEIDREEMSDGRHPIHEACTGGGYDVVELLLDRKALIEANSFRGLRPLHCAALSGHSKVINLLLDRQATMDTSTLDKHQPLHYAAKEGHAEAVRLLCQRGAKLDVEADGKRPIHLACMSENLKAAAALMDHGCLGAVEEFNPTGLLKMQQESPIEDMMRKVEQLRFQHDEAEELSEVGQDEDAEEIFSQVVGGYLGFGMINSAKSTHAAATRCGIKLVPIK